MKYEIPVIVSICLSVVAADLRVHGDRLGLKIGTAYKVDSTTSNTQYSNLIKKHANIVTAENDCKFNNLRTSTGAFDFAKCDNSRNWALANNIEFRGHTLVWRTSMDEHPYFNPLSAQLARGDIVNHVTTVLNHYKGNPNFKQWDVVNEALQDAAPGADGLVKYWVSSLYTENNDYVELAMRTARTVDPAVRIFYNDWSTQFATWGHWINQYAMVRDFINRGVPIDGVGFQCHVNLGADGSPAYTVQSVKDALAPFADLMVAVQITELDVQCVSSPCNRVRQAEIYRNFLQACAETPHCTALITWGITDAVTYMPGVDLFMFDAQYQAKQAYTYMDTYLAGLTSIPARNDFRPDGTLASHASRLGLKVGAAFKPESAASNARYDALLNSEANMLVAENNCKYDRIRNSQGAFDFTLCDAARDYALDNGMEFRGHALVWRNSMDNHPYFSALTPTEARADIVNHITTVLNHYKGDPRFRIWDVVNEALADTNGFVSSPLYQDNNDYVELAFRTAREVDPNVRLFYNDYSTQIATWGHASNQLRMVTDFVNRDVPIDGVGFQTHVNIDSQGSPAYTLLVAKKALEPYGALGLEVHITEIDVECLASPCDRKRQAEIYRYYLQACVEAPYCTAFLAWGVTDAVTYRSGVDLFPYDTQYLPKLAQRYMHNYLASLSSIPARINIRPYVTPSSASRSSSVLRSSSLRPSSSVNVIRSSSLSLPRSTRLSTSAPLSSRLSSAPLPRSSLSRPTNEPVVSTSASSSSPVAPIAQASSESIAVSSTDSSSTSTIYNSRRNRVSQLVASYYQQVDYTSTVTFQVLPMTSAGKSGSSQTEQSKFKETLVKNRYLLLIIAAVLVAAVLIGAIVKIRSDRLRATASKVDLVQFSGSTDLLTSSSVTLG